MKDIKPAINSSTRNESRKRWHLPPMGAVVIFFVATATWIGTTAYVFGQFEIRQSLLILNHEGCAHLHLLGITPPPQPESNACRVELPFRPNLVNTGGRIWVEEQYVSIPERELISSQPLAEQPWKSHHWHLLAMECISILLLLLSVWLILKCRHRENQQ